MNLQAGPSAEHVEETDIACDFCGRALQRLRATSHLYGVSYEFAGTWTLQAAPDPCTNGGVPLPFQGSGEVGIKQSGWLHQTCAGLLAQIPALLLRLRFGGVPVSNEPIEESR